MTCQNLAPLEEDYQILGLSYLINPSPSSVRQAFHQAALRYHPDKNKDPDSVKYYTKIVKAYKNINQYIYKNCNKVELQTNLTQPFNLKRTSSPKNYSTSKNYQAAMGTDDGALYPSSSNMATQSGPSVSNCHLDNNECKSDEEQLITLNADVLVEHRQRDHDVQSDLVQDDQNNYKVMIPITLEELYHGRPEQTYQVFFPGVETAKYFELSIHAGWSDQIKFVVPTVLDEIPVKVHFSLEVLPHSIFMVDGNDLVYQVKISQIYNEEQIQIKLLKGGILTVSLDPNEFMSSTDFRISHKGLPIRLNGRIIGFGDLIIREE